MFVPVRRSKLAFWIFFLLLTCGRTIRGQEGSSAQHLYLISGTPTNYGDTSYPVSLYRLDARNKLQLAREIVTQAAGLYSIHTEDGTVFVAYPHVTPSAVSIIHTANPLLVDNVTFNPTGFDSIQNREAMAQIGTGVTELFPLRTPQGKIQLISIPDAVGSSTPRLRVDSWADYAAFRFDGEPGGPALSTAPFARVVGRQAVMPLFGHDIKVESLPPSAPKLSEDAIIWLMAMNEAYSVLAPTGIPKVEGFQDILVHARKQGLWKTIRIEGDRSRLRLFHHWLAITVGTENPQHKPGPGRENERSEATDRLPSVQDLYSSFAGHDMWLPGILVLQNLEDGRRIRIETGQEDSELLWAGDDMVLYRVNDSIYQAKISGNKLQQASVLVQDENVSEIHWVFWSQS